MEKGSKYGLMALNMKVTGNLGKHMDLGKSKVQLGQPTKAIGFIICNTGRELYKWQMGQFTQGHSLSTNMMVWALISGQAGLNTQVNGRMVSSMERVSSQLCMAKLGQDYGIWVRDLNGWNES